MSKYIKHKLIKNKTSCDICSVSEWFGNKIKLEMDHIDGNNNNDNINNLRFLCPNCHAQTKTYCGSNKL